MIRQSRPTTSGTRHKSLLDVRDVVTKGYPEKSLLAKGLYKRQGKNNTGKITVRHRGGGARRHLRVIDWKREKFGVPAVVVAVEYDPMRSANIALLHYKDGEKRYVIAPDGLKTGATLMSGPDAEIALGNALPLSKIPVGMPIHNIELRRGKGAQMVRAAGNAATIQSKEGSFVTILLPSKRLRLVPAVCIATIGQVGNIEWKMVSLGKAGRRRHMGWRPEVRGVAMHPDSHPHGGGEGRSGIGMTAPKSKWGKRFMGVKTRSSRKYSNKFMVKGK